MAANRFLQTLSLTVTSVGIIVRLPFWLLLNAIPSHRPRSQWTLKRTLTVYALRAACWALFDPRSDILLPPSLEQCSRDAQKLGFVWVSPIPQDLIVGEILELAEANGVRSERTGGFWYGPRGQDGTVGQRASPDERVVYHIHGGGYIKGTGHPTTPGNIHALVDGFLEHFGPDVRVFLPEYRLAAARPETPANPFPAALIDAIAGYRYLLHDIGFDPRNIILSGDSAGGEIAFNLARYLAVSDIHTLPVPGRMILLSPTMSWAPSSTHADSSAVRNSRSDYVQAMMEGGYIPRALLGSLPEEALRTSSWLSPGSADVKWERGMLSGIPPTMMTAGEAEYTLDSMRKVRDAVAEDMGEAFTYVEVPNATHDYFLMPWHEPERTQVLKKLGEWVQSASR